MLSEHLLVWAIARPFELRRLNRRLYHHESIRVLDSEDSYFHLILSLIFMIFFMLSFFFFFLLFFFFFFLFF